MHPDCRPLLRPRLTISKTVPLFRVDRKDRPPMFQEGLYHRAARHLDCHRNPVYLPLRQILHRRHKIRDCLAAMFDPLLSNHAAITIRDAHLVMLGGPIDTYIERELTCHNHTLQRKRFARPPQPTSALYWRSKARTPHRTFGYGTTQRGAAPF